MKNLEFIQQINKPIVVLDTNVIYPILIRDILFWLAHYDLFEPKWSSEIFNEWRSIMVKKGVHPDDIEKRIERANFAFPNAIVKNYNSIVCYLELPDKNDHHILAIAIKSKAEIIVTNNIKDFPENYLKRFTIRAMTPDNFIFNLALNNSEIAIEALNEMISIKKNPKIKMDQFIEMLIESNLSKLAELLKSRTL